MDLCFNAEPENHNVLKEIAINDPESEDIFEEDLSALTRPDDLEDVCLHDSQARNFHL